ncbi:hypothetical protein BCR41DRAFT_22837 [Lobosporangium transversale]|uniref:AIG1-type G domain-containing protein n=1 Tax=Lobosporangium transversale TaxID=64571 RepID=A0A1Y2GV39_9FUNG|nr:hypothetical protein BCR41DRAFT_22837 [Lobosporangium transversale]ORZ21878.1 hypothetical protein BCR41DRAFT_22837 [Lobosporangium transversale]|eukprot:XP_021883129.1 hypothetical protein BCR41DRAFT_22837 [Lobosporangium transversale]
MFERLKFKKKTDPVQPGPKAEASPTLESVSSLPPPSSTSSDALGRSDSNGSNGSDGSSARHTSLHLKASLTSLNNNSTNSRYSTPNTHYSLYDSPMLSNVNSNTTTEINYKVPLEDTPEKIKVPISISNEGIVDRVRSNTFGAYGSHNSFINSVNNANSNITLPHNVGNNGLGVGNNSINNTNNNATMASSTSAPSMTGSEGIGDDNTCSSWRSSSQGPKINAATKPVVGAFSVATGSSIIPPDLSERSIVPIASSNSSATPSRSSSTSNRGDGVGATGVSSAESFTPVSATPPMTPRLVHNATVPHDTHTQPQPHIFDHQSQQHTITPSSNILPTVAASAPVGGQYQQQQPPVIRETMPSSLQALEGEEDTILSTMGLVSSPISLQPPTNLLSSLQPSSQQHGQQRQKHSPYSQDVFQHLYIPAISSSEGVSSIITAMSEATTEDDLQQSNSATDHHHVAVRDNTLLQQQEYQRQQLAQFQEDLNRINSSTSSDGFLQDITNNVLQHQSQPQPHPQIHQQNPSSPLPSSYSGKIPLVTTSFSSNTSSSAESSSLASVPASVPTVINSAATQTSLIQQDDDDLLQQRLRDRLLSAEENQNLSIMSPGYQQQRKALDSFVRHGGISTSENGTIVTDGAQAHVQMQVQNHDHGQVGFSAGSLVGGDGSSFFPQPVTRSSTAMTTSHLITHDVRQITGESHIIEGSGPVVLIAIGKTGQGKSSLLNKIMGTSELKASASVRAVTKGIAERTGWGRFEDSRRVLVTLADTPGNVTTLPSIL